MEIRYIGVREPDGRYATVPAVDMGRGLSIPERFIAELTDHGMPAVITVEVAVEGGTPVCDSILIRREAGGPAVTADLLRRIPLAEIIQVMSINAAWTLSDESWQDVDTDRIKSASLAAEVVPSGVRLAGEEHLRRRTRRRITEALLEQVAAVYRTALDGPEGGPTLAVAEHFMVPHSTAARYVGLARKGGFLGPTTAGRAGEHRTKGKKQ